MSMSLLLVAGLQVVLLASPAGWAWFRFAKGMSPTYQSILTAAIDPVIVLFLGGFFLALGAVKAGLDVMIASTIFWPFGVAAVGDAPRVQLVTASFLLWMSSRQPGEASFRARAMVRAMSALIT